jgi:hypothetical protein
LAGTCADEVQPVGEGFFFFLLLYLTNCNRMKLGDARDGSHLGVGDVVLWALTHGWVAMWAIVPIMS